MIKGIFFRGVLAVILLGLLIFFSSSSVASVLKENILRAVTPLLRISGKSNLSQVQANDLVGENQSLRAENFELEDLRQENQTLKKALSIKDNQGLALRGAQVIYYGRELGKAFLLIGRGKNDGVKEGDAVIDENKFFVGVVKEAFGELSKVEVASNPGETYEVELSSSKIRAIAKGIGAETLAVELLPPDTQIKKGDFVTLIGVGVSGGARYSLLLGEIARIKEGGGSAFQEARAILLADPRTLRHVFVVESGK